MVRPEVTERRTLIQAYNSLQHRLEQLEDFEMGINILECKFSRAEEEEGAIKSNNIIGNENALQQDLIGLFEEVSDKIGLILERIHYKLGNVIQSID